VVYERTGKAAFLPHLSLMQVMERSLLRAGIPLRFTGGFNPKPVLEFAQAAPVGVESLEEVFSFETFEEPSKTPGADSEEAFVRRLNACLPESLRVVSVSSIIYREKEKKPPSLMSLYAGGRYELEFPPDSPELEKTVLGVFEGKSGFREVSRNENLLVFDYTEEQGSRGFRSLLKETLGERLPEIKVRKLLTRCRLGGKIGSYREIAEIGKNEG
jgi:radical SAM-linked protein